ncbi:kinase inhibitor [Pseudodesulfovibrio sp. zrk46]|uniref:kinase inhibitor n=1 Tax=Pseudodesulfovibrio sp. zrk46 TaxID=2725288 RepID=UPI001449C77A|nr:kinase inhibitor [Pseudodesulfovibrio sp. zrk46]QJB56528.1 kinase inhibitor [Pseudodesulfovibrio sp. zrk46]
MRKSIYFVFMALAIITVTTGGGKAIAGQFTLTSPTITNDHSLPEAHVLNGFGCSGGNLSPALQWADAPAGTKSFALTMYDPDAPTGSGWWHWVVFNIPASVSALPEGAGTEAADLPRGAVQSRTDFGSAGYGGACPPQDHGDHHYIFTIHALDVEKLDLTKDSSAAMVGYFLNSHTLGSASITARYGR